MFVEFVVDVRRMQLELEIFRQLQMKRKEAPRPSDSSDNSAPSGAPSSAAVGAKVVTGTLTGVVSASSVGAVSSSVDSPTSSVSDRGSGPSSYCPKSSSVTCHNDLRQTVLAAGQSTVDNTTSVPSYLKSQAARGEPVTASGRNDHPPSTAAVQSVGLQSTASHHRLLAHCSQPVLSLCRRGSRPTRHLAKPPRPRPLSCGLVVDTVGDTSATLSQGVSRCDSQVSPVSPVILSTPDTSTQPVTTLSQGVSQCDSDMSHLASPSQTLSRCDGDVSAGSDIPVTLSQGVSQCDSDMSYLASPSQTVSRCDGDVSPGSDIPVTLSEGVSQCYSDMSPVILSTPERSYLVATSSPGVSQSVDTGSDTSLAAAAAMLSKPPTLSADADIIADIQLEAFTHDAAVSARHTDASMTQL